MRGGGEARPSSAPPSIYCFIPSSSCLRESISPGRIMPSARSHLCSSVFICGSLCLLFAGGTVLLFACGVGAAEPFRTDGGDPALPWYQLKPGVFPPVNSWHAVSGELIALDHVN